MELPKLQLPRVFAEEWLRALRSGMYTQTKGVLWNSVGYCCLGVACVLEGVPQEAFVKDGTHEQHSDEERFCGLPYELPIKWRHRLPQPLTQGMGPWPSILACLNDGYPVKAYYEGNVLKASRYFPGEPPIDDVLIINGYEETHSFPEIADWIEQHVGFVD